MEGADDRRASNVVPFRRRRPARGADAATALEEGGRWRSLAALILLMLLALGCVWLTNTLRHEGQVEDCLMAGRRDCDALVTRR